MTGLKESLIRFPVFLQVLQSLFKLLLGFLKSLLCLLLLLHKEIILPFPKCLIPVIIISGLRQGLINFEIQFLVLFHIIFQLIGFQVLTAFELFNLLLQLLELLFVFVILAFLLVFGVQNLFVQDSLIPFKRKQLRVEVSLNILQLLLCLLKLMRK